MIKKNLFKNLSLKVKLIILYGITIFLPLIIVSQVVVSISGDKIVNQTIEINQESTRQLNRNIGDLFSKYANISDRICYYDDVLKQYLTTSRNYSSVIESVDAYDKYLKLLSFYDIDINNASAFLKVYYLNTTLLSDANNFVFADNDVKQTIPYKAAFKANGELVWGYLSGSNRIFQSRIFLDDSSKMIGVVSIELQEEKLYSLIQEAYKKDKLILICDDKGTIISSNDRSILGNSIRDKRYFHGVYKDERGIFDYKDKGKYKVIYETVQKVRGLNNWKIITLIPIDILLLDANKVKTVSAFICFICLILSSLLFVVFLGNITKRINRLVRKMRTVKEGDFVIVEDKGPMDEIGIMIENFNSMVKSLEKLVYENYEVNLKVKDIALKKREAELYALQSQINPHFMFNTLESIRMKLYNEQDNTEAAGMIMNLSRILRKSLNWNGEIIKLSEEIDFIKNYLEINKARYKDKLEYSIGIPEELLDCKIPKLIIQPLIENSMKHGLEKKSRIGILSITAYEFEGKLIITIEDNGVGMNRENLEKLQQEIAIGDTVRGSERIGIKNVQDRLILHYGNNYGITIESTLEKGTIVLLKLPINKE